LAKRRYCQIDFSHFKPIKNVEFDVISQLIKDIPDYNIKFAFVTISKTHPNLIFDTNQKGYKNIIAIVVLENLSLQEQQTFFLIPKLVLFKCWV
jgi:hypothetical protein